MTDEIIEQVSPLVAPASRIKPARPRKPPQSARVHHEPQPKKVSFMAKDTKLIEERLMQSAGYKPIEDRLNEQNVEIKDVLALSDDPEEQPKLLRRRSQDEMLRALRLLASGQQRPRDDDSPQVLEDAIYEVATLRQIVADLMQGATTMYQQGLAAIRKMTER
jgi:hypothetical protein